MENILWKPSDLIGLLNLGRSTVYNLIASGELKAIRFGRAVRVPQSTLDEFIREKLQQQET
jgi:excisionase family DNA binding protein